jgi:hypothetical protein
MLKKLKIFPFKINLPAHLIGQNPAVIESKPRLSQGISPHSGGSESKVVRSSWEQSTPLKLSGHSQ